MINRVLLAGRVVQDPVRSATPSGIPLTLLTLELRATPSALAEDATADVCAVEVHALGEGRAQVLGRYVQAGRDLMVEGRLREHEGRLIVRLDRFHFLESGLCSQGLWAPREGAPSLRAA